ncbi:MAG: hypothetical protein A2Y38_00905 [Spirochaetes bacterium GWB1_59_5]|nr:MAG: hypothetical protein A2Y38_00905 [Spirochaetes bacterium GWB1_59_5]
MKDNRCMQVEFRITVKDLIFGALALQAFAEMVRNAFGMHYRSGQIDFEMSQAAGSRLGSFFRPPPGAAKPGILAPA